MNHTIQQLQQRLNDMQSLHAVTYEVITTARKQVPIMDAEGLSDCVFLLNECSKLADDTRKECNALSELMQKFACLRWSQSMDDGPIRGELCTATPRIGEARSIPSKSKQPEEYARLMEHLGIADSETSPLRPHWPDMVAYVTSRAEQGLPPPPGMEKSEVFPTYALTVRRVQR